jgi:multiple sugar transport system permease protein
MTQVIQPKRQFDERTLQRQRWAWVGWVYGGMLALAVFFLGPFVVAYLGSLKDNPLEWPFRANFAQVQPKNWGAAWRLGQQGAGNGLLGGFAPGANIPFEVSYFVPKDVEPAVPIATVPERKAGAGLGAIFDEAQASSYARVSEVKEIDRRPATIGGLEGQVVRYGFSIAYQGQGPKTTRLPLDVEAQRGQQFLDATLDPNRLERRGRVASWNSVAPGFLGYTFNNFVRVFREARDPNSGSSFFLRWTANTFFVCIMVVLTTLLFASLGGYALARMNFPGKNFLFAFIVFTMTVPSQATFISNYLVLRDMGLLGSLWGLVVWSAVGAGAVFIMKQFFENIPREIEEAALIDGASPVTTFFRIILPMATPALGALTIMTFQGTWNEFFKAAVVLSGQQGQYTLPLGLSFFRNAYGVAGDWGLMLASAFLSMIPIIVLFVVFQRYFVEGVSTTALKG